MRVERTRCLRRGTGTETGCRSRSSRGGGSITKPFAAAVGVVMTARGEVGQADRSFRRCAMNRRQPTRLEIFKRQKNDGMPINTLYGRCTQELVESAERGTLPAGEGRSCLLNGRESKRKEHNL